MKTTKQLFNILSNQQKRLLGTNYSSSLSCHNEIKRSHFAIFIHEDTRVIYHNIYSIDYYDLDERLDKLIAFISRLLIK